MHYGCKRQFYRVDDQGDIRMSLLEQIQKTNKFMIDNNAINFGKLEYVSNVIWLQSVICRRNNTARSRDAVDGFQKGRRIWRENANALQAVLLQIVGQASGAIGEFLIGPVQYRAVGSDVKDGLGIGLDGCGALQEKGWRQLVDVRRRGVLGDEMAEN